MDAIAATLIQSEDPSIRYKVTTGVLGAKPGSEGVRRLQMEVRGSPRVQKLLSERQADGQLPYHPYAKWTGAHWLLATLADIGYPPGDESLIPLREQVYDWLLSEEHANSIPTINGRVRRHASMEANAIYATLALGLADERTDELVRHLLESQWPDGGWNCDKTPRASNSSFHESLIPLRALALHARLTGNAKSQGAVERAAEVFLKRHLFKAQGDGSIIRDAFVKLHYPPYWQYDFLFGLKVMGEAGRLQDPRCKEALELLKSKRLPDGGWPAEGKHYSTGASAKSGRSLVGWGVTGARRMNEFVTAEALGVLTAAGKEEP